MHSHIHTNSLRSNTISSYFNKCWEIRESCKTSSNKRHYHTRCIAISIAFYSQKGPKRLFKCYQFSTFNIFLLNKGLILGNNQESAHHPYHKHIYKSSFNHGHWYPQHHEPCLLTYIHKIHIILLNIPVYLQCHFEILFCVVGFFCPHLRGFNVLQITWFFSWGWTRERGEVDWRE